MRAVLAASMLLMMPVAASAGEVDYTADQVVAFFAASADLGAERGICIGTAKECKDKGEIAASSFDLLVHFELDSDVLSEQAKANLLEFAKALKDPRLSHVKFSIEGHTDARGSDTYNQRLSVRRADAVVTFLREHGADTSRFVIKGFGEANPRAADPYDPVNRRVETRIVQ